MQIVIINGPNLNLLGTRKVEIYGNKTFESYFVELKDAYAGSDIDLHYYQSNHEGYLIDKLHEVGFASNTSIILNAGGYTHTSIALRDAVEAINNPVVEVHISDIHKRESFRAKSYLTEVCQFSVIGKGLPGYQKAIDYLLDLAN